MQPPIGYLEKILHTSIHQITPFKRNWLIETLSGDKWIAKKIESLSQLNWWLRVDMELRRRGFIYMPKIYSDRREWLLSSFIGGKTSNYLDLNEGKKIIKILGKFHYSGKHLLTPSYGAAFLLYHRLYERLVSYHGILKNVDNLDDDLRSVLETSGRDFYLDGLDAWNKLDRSLLYKLNIQDQLSSHLCHRDLASHNWLIDSNGDPWLIDFDTAAFDCQVGDVWQITSRMFARQDWDENSYAQLLEAYEDTRPLNPTEKQILGILHLFPNEFYRETIGLFKKKKGYTIKHSLPYIQNLAEQRSKSRIKVKRIFF